MYVYSYVQYKTYYKTNKILRNCAMNFTKLIKIIRTTKQTSSEMFMTPQTRKTLEYTWSAVTIGLDLTKPKNACNI